ncbi:mitotic spindle assembly checkpoint protein MAD1-like [Amphiura filiformis]|uniref:mitotic spindle assembly checkpoint protein MAD1-like n=1 Tax=Amphiura filiformis TaxID=82378 RepID=UPI003B2202EC
MYSPEDNTTVVRMMGEFENYFKKDIERHKKEQEAREKQGELVSAQSRIARLETEVEVIKSHAKRSRLEFERDQEKDKLERMREQEKLVALKQQLEFVAKKEDRAKNDLEEVKQTRDIMKKQFEEQVHDLRQQKLKLETTLQDLQLSSRAQISRLSNEVNKKDAESKMLQNDLDEAKAQLSHQIRRGIDASSNRRAADEYRMQNDYLQQRIQELEQKLLEQEDSATVARAVHNDVKRLAELEKENKKLTDENRYYKEVNENNALLKEVATSMETKLARAEKRTEELARLQVENEDLRAKLRRWECMDFSDGNTRPSSPSQLSSRIAELQHQQAALLEKQGQYMASSHSHEQALKSARDELMTNRYRMLALEEEKKKQDELLRQLQKRLLLLTKERDSMKQIYNSYDTEALKAGYQSQNFARLKQAEDNLQSCHRQIEALEIDIKGSKEDASQYRLQVKQLESQVSHLQEELSHAKATPEPTPFKTPDEPSNDTELMKKQIEELEQELYKMSERNELLEARFEQRELQGDYDPTKLKVISFSMNPASMARQERAGELSKLREECETLRQRVKFLEESGPNVDDVTMQVSKKLKEGSSQEVEALKKEVKACELKNQRLKEVFAKKIQEFREACYRLTGYQINNPAENQYHLMSMYAESASDVLLFQTTSTGDMQLLENDFSSTLTDFIESFLQQQHSIPAFLSSVTLDLFSRQTMVTGAIL